MFEWVGIPNAWVGLLTLTLLEIVLGIDNVVFISILTGRLPLAQRARGMRIGLILAVVPRVLLLLAIGWVMGLNQPLFDIPFMPEHDPHLLEMGRSVVSITGQDLVFLIGGLFLVYKSVKEIHHKLEGADEVSTGKVVAASFMGVMGMVMLVNVVFSLDSVITAVGMIEGPKVGGPQAAVTIMILAVLLSTVAMIAFATPVAAFVERHPTVKMLALSFLILIGVNLLAEGFHQHIPKGYTYFAMAFAVCVEMLNLRLRKGGEPVHLKGASMPHEGATEAPSAP